MSGARNHYQPPGTGQRVVYALRVSRGRLAVVEPVDEKHGNVDAGRCLPRRHFGDMEGAALLRERQRPVHIGAGRNPRCALADHDVEIGEGRLRDDSLDARLVGSRLEGNRRPEGRAEEDGAVRADGVEGASEVPPFVEAVRAVLTFRFAVRAAVVGEDVVSLGDEAAREADPGAAVVGDTVQVDDQAPSPLACGKQPAFQEEPVAAEADVSMR